MEQLELKSMSPVSLKEQVVDSVSAVEKTVDILESTDASLKDKLDAVEESVEAVSDVASSVLKSSVVEFVVGKETAAELNGVVVAAESAVVEAVEAVEAVQTAVEEVKEALENPKDIGEVLEAVAAVSSAAVETVQALNKTVSLFSKVKKVFSCMSCRSQVTVSAPCPQDPQSV